MAPRKRKQAKSDEAAIEPAPTPETTEASPEPARSQHTEDRLTDSERCIMERFFGLGPRYPEWPVSALQRRMQSSRG